MRDCKRACANEHERCSSERRCRGPPSGYGFPATRIGGRGGFGGGMSLTRLAHQMTHEEDTMTSKLFRYGGIAASIVLIAFGIGSVVTGFDGRDQVRSNLAREQIVGTPDSSIPNQKVDTGAEAQAFAKVMRKHTLEATGGQTYSQMGQFLDNAGKPTSDEKAAAIDPKTNKPVANPARQVWVTETALTTALNTAFFAESVATFAIVMGFALLLVGVGFLVLTLMALRRPAASTEAEWKASRAAPTVG
jgi:hypothetical protein